MLCHSNTHKKKKKIDQNSNVITLNVMPFETATDQGHPIVIFLPSVGERRGEFLLTRQGFLMRGIFWT